MPRLYCGDVRGDPCCTGAFIDKPYYIRQDLCFKRSICFLRFHLRHTIHTKTTPASHKQSGSHIISHTLCRILSLRSHMGL